MAKFTPSRKSLKATIPGRGGGGNSLLNYIMLQQQNQDTTGSVGDVVQQVQDQFPEGSPPGSDLNIGRTISANVPLNRKLTGEEAAAISSQQVFGSTGSDIKKKTQGGVFNSPFGNIGRTFRQFAAQQPNALITSYDQNLQSMQSKISSIKRYVFGEGGKQLTPYEGKIVNALISPVGKSDDQYVSDVDEALKLVNAKADLIKGGSNAAKSPIPGMQDYHPIPGQGSGQNTGDDRINKLQAIKDRFKQRNP